MMLNHYLALCQQFERQPDSPLFARIVANAGVLSRTQADLATSFEVAESTVSRWAKGTARPHPRIQKFVVSELRRVADRTLKLQNQPVPARVTEPVAA
jgi:hypothetical protein